MSESQHQLSHEWRRWVARNKLIGTSPDVMVQILTDNAGLAEPDARQKVDELVDDPTFQGAVAVAEELRKLQSIFDIRHQLLSLVPSSRLPERRRGVRRGDFLARYYSTNTPVVMTDLTDHWPARRLWTPDYFDQYLGSETVEVMGARGKESNYERDSDAHRTRILFSQYLNHVVKVDASNEMYLVANNHLLELPVAKRLWEDFDSPPEYFDADGSGGKVFLWLGPAGTVTPLHHDIMNVLLVQVLGTKRIRLVSPLRTHCVYNDLSVYSQVDAAAPDYTSYPEYRAADPIEIVLEAGDALFIPVGWWHHVEALEMSISLSFTNFLWPNTYGWWHPTGGHGPSRS